MHGVIKVIVFTSVLQVGIGAFFTGLIVRHAMSDEYAHTQVLVQNVYSQLQRERDGDREDMKRYIDNRISLKLFEYDQKKQRNGSIGTNSYDDDR